MASPAITETATGRNTGSTTASAAAGNSAPLLSTAPRKAGPSPGRGPIPVTLRNTATSVGRPASSAMLTQVRGRRTSLRSSTRSIAGLLATAAADVTAGPAGERQEDVLQRGTLHHQLADPHTALHQVPVERLRAGAVEVDDQAVVAPLAQLGPDQAGRQLGGEAKVRRGDLDTAGGGEQGAHPVLDHQATPVHDRRAVADLLDLREQVARQEHRGAAADQLDQQIADVAHALRVEPVGGLVQ